MVGIGEGLQFPVGRRRLWPVEILAAAETVGGKCIAVSIRWVNRGYDSQNIFQPSNAQGRKILRSTGIDGPSHVFADHARGRFDAGYSFDLHYHREYYKLFFIFLQYL